MELFFRNKSESNEAQQKAFLKLEPIERIYSFLHLMYQLRDFPSDKPSSKKNNFVIEIKSKK